MEEDLIQILPDGQIRFRRGNKEHNEMLLEILSQLISSNKVEEVKKFFEEGEEIILLEGNEILCG